MKRSRVFKILVGVLIVLGLGWIIWKQCKEDEEYNGGVASFPISWIQFLVNRFSFDPKGDDGVISSIVIQPDGKILIGGWKTNRIVRLNSDVTLDDTFNPKVNGSIRSIAIQPDGKILIGGWLTPIDQTKINGIVRLNPDGTLDDTFDPKMDVDSAVFSIVIQPDRKILIERFFASIGRSRMARLNPDGTLDDSFGPNNADSNIRCIAVQPNGKILIEGWLSTIDQTLRDVITRLNPDGTFDATFNLNANGGIHSIAIQPDGKILIGGWLSSTIGQTKKRNGIVRLNPDGTLDATFNPNVNKGVEFIAIQTDGKVLIGGYFSTIDEIKRNGLARLNPDGTLDTTFNPNAKFFVQSIAVQPNGKILVGGSFITRAVIKRHGVARLNPDGTLDTIIFKVSK